MIPAEVVREAADGYDYWNAEARRLMLLMGVPEAVVGVSQFGRNKSEAFSLSSAAGGTHSVPVFGHVYVPDFCVDLATLDPGFTWGNVSRPSWKDGAVEDRMQAVIVHEFEEALAHARGHNEGAYPEDVQAALRDVQSADYELSIRAARSVHDYGHLWAIMLAPRTQLRMLSAAARRMLVEYVESLSAGA